MTGSIRSKNFANIILKSLTEEQLEAIKFKDIFSENIKPAVKSALMKELDKLSATELIMVESSIANPNLSDD